MIRIFCLLALLAMNLGSFAQKAIPEAAPAFKQLPLGDIRPGGWLLEMLERQRTGSTGSLDNLYPTVMGDRNGWLGGDGDQWERGPYWIDGLLPLAYILDDTALKNKAQRWVEWAINSQQPDGYFGPAKDYTPEPGLQRDNSRDWWPKMVMLKIMQQYYSATKDQRVIKLLSGYFKYQLKTLPKKPLDHWTFWSKFRAGDNLLVVYWLYDITKEPFLLELGELLHRQSFDFTEAFLHTDFLQRPGSIHTVNLAQGFKEPVVYWQQHREKQYIEAVKKGFADLDKYNGMAHGLYGGDEALHGNNPTQGSELCTAVEMMYSLETMLEITGDLHFADRLEKIAFNVLPAQISDDFMTRQYFLQANQVMLTRADRNFDVNHSGTDLCFGLLTGYPCCTSNMHQGWPKFTQHLFYTTDDGGVAALVYAPSEMTAMVKGHAVKIKEETNYPFSDRIGFTIETKQQLSFNFYLRIPDWCKEAQILVNGKLLRKAKAGALEKINRTWKDKDVIELVLPMHIYHNTWYENSVSVERGPLVYGLRIKENERQVVNNPDSIAYGSTYTEILPGSPWNYGLPETSIKSTGEAFEVKYNPNAGDTYPWNNENAPIVLKTNARQIPFWKLYNEMAGPIPYSIIYHKSLKMGDLENIELVPMGCTRLRITQFPVLGR